MLTTKGVGIKMAKTNKDCPICNSRFIVVKINRFKEEAWPACWKCGFEGHSKGETKALTVELNDNKNDELVLKEAFENWISYLLLLEEEEAEEKKEENNG